MNKLYADYEPLAYDCLEERLLKRLEDNAKGKFNITLELYSENEMAKNHL